MHVLSRILLVVVFVAHGQSAHAQATTESAAEPTPEKVELPPTAPGRAEPIAPYDNRLLRLSEVLGSIHFLRNLCGAKEPKKWRDSMNAIVIAEKPGPKRKARLIARFNRGYRAFNGTYGSCTQSAILASERYVSEGAKLASQITGRYGR